ncbi:MAG TPA: agmatinase family protein [Vicinamibacteria bacterium]|nr:agmatinase family protein [Vicinamibacteria bacterium]
MTFDPSSAAVSGGIFGLPFAPQESRVVLVPVPWEATVSYGAGTAGGPQAILAASRQVDLRDRDTGRPYEQGIAMLPIPAEVKAWSDEARALAAPVIAAGGPGDDAALRRAAAEVNALSERMNGWVHDQCGRWLGGDSIVGVVGGDHSVPFGGIQAAAGAHPGLGVLHVDAHADLRDAYEGFRWSHASIMFNVARDIPEVARIVQVGIRDYSDDEDALIRENPDRLRTYFEPDLRRQLQEGENWARLMGRVVADLPPRVWVSFDIDGLDPSLCPSTGTPVPGGLSFAEAVGLLRLVVASGRRIVGFDLSEVAPDPGGREWDANVGARVLYKLIGFALMSSARRE